jgi:hypothetical protein
MAESGTKATIAVALISLIGVLGAAVIGNWDKLKSPAQVTSDRSTTGAISQPKEIPRESTPSVMPQPQATHPESPPPVPSTPPPEDALLGHWVSTFDNPLFSVIDISRQGSEIRVKASVNNRGPNNGGCVYDAILDGNRGVVAKEKTVEWQLPTLPLPCANWVSPGFTGASISVATADNSPDTLATVVNMYAGQKVLAGSGPQKYVRR